MSSHAMSAGASFSTAPSAWIDPISGVIFGRSVAKFTFDASSQIGDFATR